MSVIGSIRAMIGGQVVSPRTFIYLIYTLPPGLGSNLAVAVP